MNGKKPNADPFGSAFSFAKTAFRKRSVFCIGVVSSTPTPKIDQSFRKMPLIRIANMHSGATNLIMMRK